MATGKKIETILEIRSQLDGKALQEFDRLCKSAGVASADLGKKAKKSMEEIDVSANKSAGSMLSFYTKLAGAALAIKQVYTAAKEQHEAQILLNNAWKNDGQAIGLTKKELAALGQELQEYAGGTKASIDKTQAFLLDRKSVV